MRRLSPPAGPWLAAVVVTAAALSLLLPGVSTYDPFAWIIWGREITEGALVTTSGPSWKPLPVMFTTVFALFGSASPVLWLLVARAGAIGALIAVWRLVRRLGGGVAGAAFAAVALGLAPWWLRNAGLGNSEGLTILCVAAALERGLAGRHRDALLWGCGAALLRPESWPFIGLYGLWLIWRRRLPAGLVVGLGAVVLMLWLVPEWVGSGHPLRAAERARTDIGAAAPTNARSPFLALLADAWEMLTPAIVVALAAAAVRLVAARDRALAGVAVLALAWLLLVALMTRGGFSGNQRYLIVPVALLIVVAGTGIGRLAALRPPAGVALAALAVVAAAVPSVRVLGSVWDKLDYQERMTAALPGLIERAGGRAAIGRCGDVGAGAFVVPQVAWYTRRHQRDVVDESVDRGTVFAVRNVAGGRWSPAGAEISAPLHAGSIWRLYQRCAP